MVLRLLQLRTYFWRCSFDPHHPYQSPNEPNPVKATNSSARAKEFKVVGSILTIPCNTFLE